ncbi:MAG: hypothetical protein HY341_02625 [Candidatus Kerfeldbacteria bacterium]|nr:hypothetical protein [Candidatus Kerfeldbacteria bacterium]
MARSQNPAFADAFRQAFPVVTEIGMAPIFVIILLMANHRALVRKLHAQLPDNCKLLDDDIEKLEALWDRYRPRDAKHRGQLLTQAVRISPVIPLGEGNRGRFGWSYPATSLEHYYVERLRNGEEGVRSTHPKDHGTIIAVTGGRKPKSAWNFEVRTVNGRAVLDCRPDELWLGITDGTLTADFTTELMRIDGVRWVRYDHRAGDVGGGAWLSVLAPMESLRTHTKQWVNPHTSTTFQVARRSFYTAMVGILQSRGLPVVNVTPLFTS